MTKEQEAFIAWKQADAQARALEALLAATWEEVMNRTGPPPTEEMPGEVSRLRALANEKLTVVMAIGAQLPASRAAALLRSIATPAAGLGRDRVLTMCP